MDIFTMVCVCLCVRVCECVTEWTMGKESSFRDTEMRVEARKKETDG
jgi:hypothetical protein